MKKFAEVLGNVIAFFIVGAGLGVLALLVAYVLKTLWLGLT